MILTKYDSYKDSGVEWLGEIPNHWEVKRVKDFLSNCIYGTSEKTNSEGKIEIMGMGEIKKGEIILSHKNFLNKIDDFLLLKKGDILYTRTNGSFELIGKAGILKKEIQNLSFASYLVRLRIRPCRDEIYYNYLFNSNQFRAKARSICISTAQNNLKSSKYINIVIPDLKKNEQIKISNFLDKKTAQIDKKIKLLQEKKGSYEELKKSLINEIVCRGINKNVELKDSGVEWIGKIPKHWKIERLKDQFSLISSGIYSFKEKKEYLSTKSISINKIEKIEETITFEKRPSRANMQPIINSVWFAKLRFTKKSYLFDDLEETKKYILSTGFAGLRTKSINSKFVNYYICSEYFLYQKDITSYGTTQEAITEPNINQIFFVCPQKEEQIQIVNYLDEKTSKIDKTVSKINDQIETLKEFRKTLINDVVTGKVRIQDE
jgi:type I restriction enzyme S subunit